MSKIPMHVPGIPEANLTAELERFSFGIAVSTFAEVEQVHGPGEYVRTVARLGGVVIDHAQHPDTSEQRIIATGATVPQTVAGYNFMFDTRAALLMAWMPNQAGPIPVPGHITEDLSQTIKSFNDDFAAQA